MLNWRNITSSNDSRFFIKGTELNVAFCGQHKRYTISEVRIRGQDGFSDRMYIVRDAETVTDQQVRDGKRPAIVGQFDNLDAAVKFCT